jgi:hypothetical protein
MLPSGKCGMCPSFAVFSGISGSECHNMITGLITMAAERTRRRTTFVSIENCQKTGAMLALAD